MTTSLAVSSSLRRAARDMSVALGHPAAVYIASMSAGSRRTQMGALRIIAGFFRHSVRELEWTSLRFAEISALRSFLAEKHAPATGNRIMSCLRGVLKVSVKMGLLDHTEMVRAVDVPTIKGNRTPPGRWIPRDELARLFATASAGPHPTRDRALLAVAYGAGLRRAEIIKLRREDFRSGGVLFVHGKGNKTRSVPLPPSAIAPLEAWLRELGDVDARAKIFDLGYSTVWFLVHKLAELAGVEKISTHDFRRTYIGDLFDAGVDIRTIQALVDHTDPATTARYDRRPFRARAAAVAKLDLPV